jgi:hypothetical protein
MQSGKLQPYSILLQAFYFGLKQGIITKQEVVAWADSIIIARDTPDYFFIELSLCPDVNELLTVMSDNIVADLDIIALRATLGLLYQKLNDDIVSNKQAVMMLNSFNPDQILTPAESSWIYELDDYEQESIDGDWFTETLFEFLTIYKDFGIDNYHNWLAINEAVENTLAEYQFKWDMYAQQWNAERLKEQKLAKLKLTLIRSVFYGMALILTIALIIIYPSTKTGLPLPKFKADVFQLCVLYMALFLSYHFLSGVDWLIKRAFK